MAVYTALVPSRLGSYLLREVAALYLLGVTAFCLLLSVDYLSVMAQFLINQNASLLQVGRLLALKLPAFLHLSLPIAGVFGVLLATGRLARDSELKAAYALGIRPRAFIAPLAGFGVVVTLLATINNGWLEPLAERSYNAAVESFYSARPPAEYQSNVAWNIGGDIYFATDVRTQPDDPGTAILSGPAVLLSDGSSLTATRGVWDSRNREWTLEDAQLARPGSAPEDTGDRTVAFAFTGDPSATLMREELVTITELQERRALAADAGGSTRAEDFALHRRLADAFSGFCFVLAAAFLGASVRERAAAFALTIGLIVVFYALWTVSATMFDRGVLTAVQAAWLTPLTVAVLGPLAGMWRLRG